jgi:flavin-dependent dehydrogenase
MRRDPLIIGGGPAGAAAAITLGRAGYRPVLVERSTGPTDKVCGDFLSADSIEQATALGVELSALGASSIHCLRLIHGERVVEAALPFPALGLSRRTLDAALLAQAERAGVLVQTGQTVRHLTRDRPTQGRVGDRVGGDPDDLARDSTIPDRRASRVWHGAEPSDATMPGVRAHIGRLPRRSGYRDERGSPSHHPQHGAPLPDDAPPSAPLSGDSLNCAPLPGGTHPWTAQTADGAALIAETVFLATGKHDLRDLPRPRSDRGAVGMKMYFALGPGAARTLAGAIELTLFPGGYAGMQPVEDGQAVVCIAVQRHQLQLYGGGWPGLIAAIERGSRRFAAMLAGARTLLPRPIAVAGIPYGYQARPAVADGLFRLGDQAVVIPSLTGDGMAIALHSGKTAAELWLAGADSVAYQRALARIVAPQMRLAGVLHHACMSTMVQSAVIRAAALFPGLLRRAASHTRLPAAGNRRVSTV